MTALHGGDIYSHNKDILDFSVNINPLDAPEGIIKAGEKALRQGERYPDIYCRSLREAIEKATGISRDNIICGSGAAELIYNIAFALKPKKTLIPQPTFSEYEQAVKAAGGEVQYYYLKAENNYTIDKDFLDCIGDDTDMVFLCNPNNPTGLCTPRERVIEALEKCERYGAFAIIDECFMDFVNNAEAYSVMNEADNFDRLFILKSFTKLYIMAGARLGWGVCKNKALLDKIYGIRQPWSVSLMAQAMGEAALGELNFREEALKYIAEERAFLEGELSRLNIEYIKSEANYILIKAPLDLYTTLLERGILIRGCLDFKGLGAYFYRIAVKRHKDNIRLIKAVEEILNG